MDGHKPPTVGTNAQHPHQHMQMDGEKHVHGHMGGGMNSMPGSGMMSMGSSLKYFQLQTTSTLMVSEWTTGTIYGLVLAMLAAVMAASGFEIINAYHSHYYKRILRKPRPRNDRNVKFTCCEKLVLSCLVMLRVLLGYFMMLCVMTMNAWLITSVILGATIGYGLLNPLMTISLESPNGSDNSSSKDNEVVARSGSWRFKGFTVDQSARLSKEEEHVLIEASKKRSPRPPLNMRFSKDRLYIEQSQDEECFNGNGNTNASRNDSASRSGTIDYSIDDQPDVVLRRDPLDSTSSISTSGSTGRFKSTSKTISFSFKDEKRGRDRTSESGSLKETPHRVSRFHSTSEVIANDFNT